MNPKAEEVLAKVQNSANHEEAVKIIGEALDETYTNGFDAGYDEGQSVGYDEGFSDGKDEGESESA